MSGAEPASVVASAALQWAENFDNLLNDTEGLKLFRSFLAQEYVAHPLDFYLACVGLRKSSHLANDLERLRTFLRSLFRKYLRSNSECFVPLSDETRKLLQVTATQPDAISNWAETVEIAQEEVKALLKRSLYQQFLKSDVYVHHLQQFFPQGSESPATRLVTENDDGQVVVVDATDCNGNGLTGSTTSGAMPAIILPTLHEDNELKGEDIILQATPSSSFITSMTTTDAQVRGSKTSENLALQRQQQIPYYVSHLTAVSAVDSERSSEAMASTEAEFHSLTDSSISSYRQRWHERRQQRQQSSASGGANGRRVAAAGSGSRHHHSHHLLASLSDVHPTSSTSLRINQSASMQLPGHQLSSSASLRLFSAFNLPQNNDAMLKYQPFIPRGERPSKLSNLAQENPTEFARLLTTKLEKTIAEREKEERIERCLRECAANNNDANSVDEASVFNGSLSQMSQSGPSVIGGKQRSSAKISNSLAQFVQSLSSEQDDTADEHAQSILEDHMSRVWDKTLCLETPGMPLVGMSASHHMSMHQGAYQMHSYQSPAGLVFPDSHNAFSRSFHATTTPASAGRHVQQATPTSRNRKQQQQLVQHQQQVSNEVLSVSSYDSGVVGAGGVMTQTGSNVFYQQQQLQQQSQPIQQQQQQPLTPVFFAGPVNVVPTLAATGQPPFGLALPPAATVFVPHGTRHPLLAATAMDRTGHFDSGISIADTESAKSLPPFSSTAKQKVLNWMLHNDKSNVTPTATVIGGEGVPVTQQQQQTPTSASFCMPPPPPPMTSISINQINSQNVLQTSALPGTLSDSDTQTKSSSQTKHRACGSRSKRSNDSLVRQQAEESSSSICGGGGGSHAVHEYTTVAYKFSDEEIPYRSQLPGKNVTLRQFKQLITKRGVFRFYFKHATDEFPGGCVNEEVMDDDTVLPLYDGKIFARVERIDLNATVSVNS